MTEIKNILKKFTKSEIVSLLYIPATLIYLELGLRIKIGIDFSLFLLPCLVLWLTLGLILGAFTLLFKKELTCKILGGAVILSLCFYFITEAFIRSSYQVFMPLLSVAKGAGGVLTDFTDELFSVLTGGFFFIVAMLLPAAIFFVLIYKNFSYKIGAQAKSTVLGLMFALAFVLNIAGAKIILSSDNMLGVYRNAYNFDNAVSSFGLLTATRLDLQYSLFGNPYADSIVFEEPEIPDEPEEPEEILPNAPEEPTEQEYGYNVLEIDFEGLISETTDNSLANIHKYISSVAPSQQNEYTGLFKGKNLILITAESFAKEVIDPEFTPTLYRLYSNGFTFTDFYQPTWGGSTTTGEYSVISGLVPHYGVESIHRFVNINTGFTIGSRLAEEGYSSFAYHNGNYNYYGRDLTHTKFGYSSYKGIGNGLEEGVDSRSWPASDREMMEFTFADYADKQPFSVYYMTVSGHGTYNPWHPIAQKNFDKVEHLECSATLQSYYAANLELEYAMASLIELLENKGIADDTVIVICTDHYPYALQKGEAWQNEEDYLEELYGYPITNNMERDHNALIIWSGCLENEYKDLAVTVDSPSYSLDILPTLNNLFGIEYDSRLFVGRDLLSNAEPIILWPDYNWKTDRGYYNFTTKEFIPSAEGVTVDEDYINRINAAVKNKIAYSKAVITYDYFNVLFGEK